MSGEGFSDLLAQAQCTQVRGTSAACGWRRERHSAGCGEGEGEWRREESGKHLSLTARGGDALGVNTGFVVNP